MLQGSHWLLGTFLGDGPISLMDFTLAKHLIQSRKGFAGSGKYHKSGHRPVQTVYYSEKYISRFSILLFDIILHSIRKGDIASLIALNDFPTLFVYNNQVIVFVNNFHPNLFNPYIFIPPST